MVGNAYSVAITGLGIFDVAIEAVLGGLVGALNIGDTWTLSSGRSV